MSRRPEESSLPFEPLLFSGNTMGAKKKKGGGIVLPDSAIITVKMTAGNARALVSALTTSWPPDSKVAKATVLKLVQALASGGGKKKGKKGKPGAKSIRHAVVASARP
jgi:hypothetical protein